MANWTAIFLSTFFILGLCLAQEQADIMLNTRPSRPERFDDAKAVRAYIQKLKDYYQGTRFGKRYSLSGSRLLMNSRPVWKSPAYDYDETEDNNNI